MAFLKKIERYFGICLIIGVLFGFLFPQFLQQYESYVIYILMMIMGFVFLKVDIVDVVTHMKRPLLMVYISIINMIFIPIVGYFLIFRYLEPSLGIGLLLLSALPTGVSAVAFTDIMKGRTSLNLTIVMVSNILSIFTIPFIFWFLARHNLPIDYMQLMGALLKVIFIPFFIAKVLKRVVFPDLVEKLQECYNPLILLLLSAMMMISISLDAQYILENIDYHMRTLGILYLAFFLFQLVGYFSLFPLKKGEKLAMSNATMIMNNILGIVLAIAFFGPEVRTVVVLSFIPWSTMIMAKHWYRRFLP